MLLIELALLPAIVLVLWIYRQDRIEKEPKGLLRKVFLWGALSVIPAVILEMLLEEVLLVFVDADTLSYLALENFIGIALVEEYCKMKAAKKVAWRHPAFNYRFDAIVYCCDLGAWLRRHRKCLLLRGRGLRPRCVARPAVRSVACRRRPDHGLLFRSSEGGGARR